MAVLKARVGGAWQTIGLGGGINPGGVGGDILVKNSATNGDALWGTTMPKLTLGNLQTAQYPPMQLSILDSQHATSRRAHVGLGSGWSIGQDFNASGVKDFYLFNVTGNRAAMTIDATGRVFSFGDGSANTDIYLAGIQTTPNLATSPRLTSDGNYVNLHGKTDAYIDGNTITFRSAAFANLATLSAAGLTIGGGNIRYSTEFVVASTGVMTHLGTGHYWLNAAGNAWHMQHDGTTLRQLAGGYSFNAIGYMFKHDGDTDTGLYYDGDGSMRWIVNGQTGLWVNYIAGGATVTIGGGYGASLRLYNKDDANHSLQYSGEAASAVDPASGLASNGPKLQGYSTVWLRTVLNGRSFLFESGLGNCNIPSVGSYAKFSSIEIKEDIEPIDLDDSLAQVMRWEPVQYFVKDEPTAGLREGFIAEHLHAVTPRAVVCTPSDAERPNWPNAIDYGGLTVRLTAAVQALAHRIERLEGHAA